MKTHTFSPQRDSDFLHECMNHPAWQRNRDRAAIETAVTARAPRYYVDVDYAYRRILDMRNHGKIPTRGMSRRLWTEIFDKVAAKVAINPRITILDAVVAVITEEKASAFFISPQYAVKIVRGYNRRRKSNL